MMEAIRTWRPGLAWPRAAFARVRSWRILHFTKLALAILLFGMITGAMTVIFPPMASIGMVALAAVVLLWAMPDLHVVPDRMLRKAFFAMVFAQLCVPAYYAIDTGLLPWISVRRFFSLAVIVLFAVTVAGSRAERQKISEIARDNRLLFFCACGFLVTIFLSIFTTISISQSTASSFDSLLNWYIPFFACILVVRSERDVRMLTTIFVWSAIIVAVAGFIEFIVQRRYFFDIFPRSLLQDMMARNPALAMMYNVSMFRNGFYRAASIFSVSLSFGEFLAMIAPIAAYFILHGEKWKSRALGAAALALILAGIIASGARGAYLCFIVAMPLTVLLWMIRQTRFNPASLAGPIILAIFLAGFGGVMSLVFISGKLSNMVFGGADTAASTEARFIQWNAAKPHIISNPVTGHGVGSSGDLIGFAAETGVPSVDSYPITLLVEQGVPGFLLFFAMVAVGIWIGVRIYLTNTEKIAEIAGPLACSLVAFGIYRLVLSQRENHTLFFLMIGLLLAVSRICHERQRSQVRKDGWPLPDFGAAATRPFR
jgi:O-antigen ligase